MLVSVTAPIRSGRVRESSDAIARNARAVAMLISARSSPPEERRRIHQQVVLDYLDVAHAVAGRYRSPSQDPHDLRQVAYVGLTKAVQRFEPERGEDIVSFVVPTISGEIKRYLRDSTWTVRPPRSLQELHAELRRSMEDLTQRLGREPTLAELAEAAGKPPAVVAEALGCAQGRQPVSLDTPVGGEAREAGCATLGDALPAPATDFERADLAITLAQACRSLSPSERRILHLRFYREYTQTQIAAECGVSQMQVSRLLTRILGTLRARLVASPLD